MSPYELLFIGHESLFNKYIKYTLGTENIGKWIRTHFTNEMDYQMDYPGRDRTYHKSIPSPSGGL